MQLPPLREREKKILFFLRLWQFEKRCSPSAKEIGDVFGVKRQSIAASLDELRRKGYIEMSHHKGWQHRTILMPKGMTFPWGNESLPDELFDHMRERQVNG